MHTHWLLSETTEVMWSECNTLLVTFNGLLERRNCPLEVNAKALEALLPQLEKAEEEGLQKEETLKRQQAERKKMGPPEDMTVRLLIEVLDDLNITYRSREKKADLIEKFVVLEQIYTLIYIMHHTTTTLEVTPFPLLSSGILELCLKTTLLLGKTSYVFIIYYLLFIYGGRGM